MARWTLIALVVLVPALAAADGEPPYPVGRSTQTIEGLKVVLIVPETMPAHGARSLVVALHPAAGPASNMADLFDAWPAEGYVVCAPEARDMTWEVGDLESVKRLIPHLIERLAIDPRRVHLVGYSDGGTNMDRVAFADEVKPCSATWVAATYNGNRVPRWAKQDLGVLALLGSRDEELERLRGGMARLDGKVASVEVRVAQGVGHRFPFDERPYLLWWMGVREGRLEPGKDLGFEWGEDLANALASQADRKKGGVLLWVYGAEDADKPGARALQQQVFLHEHVRFYGRQLACVKLDLATQASTVEPFGVTASPALVVLDRKGKVVKVYEEAFAPRKVAATLKKLAPHRKLPR